jgi:hypothetical protein
VADFPSFNDLFRAARDEILIRNGQLSREAVERPGTDANVLIAGATACGDDVVTQLIQVQAGLFLDSATGQALDRLVFDRYGLLRKPAAAALGEVRFDTVNPSPSNFAIPVNTIVATADGRQYVTTDSASFGLGSEGPVRVPIRSVLAGSDQQAQIATIINIVSSIPNSAPDLQVDNELATAGADDAETDASLRGRARAFFTTARKGTLDAIVQGALAFPGVRTAEGFEVLDAGGHPNRLVQLVVADQFTQTLVDYNPTPPGYQEQSQILAQAVSDSLSDVRAAGIFVEVTVAVPTIQAIVLALTFTTGADTVALTQSAKGVAVNYTNSLNPGEPFVVADLNAEIDAIPGLVPTGSSVVTPAGDVVPQTLEVIRTSLAAVNIGSCDCTVTDSGRKSTG